MRTVSNDTGEGHRLPSGLGIRRERVFCFVFLGTKGAGQVWEMALMEPLYRTTNHCPKVTSSELLVLCLGVGSVVTQNEA